MVRVSNSLRIRLEIIESLGRLFYGEYGFVQRKKIFSAKRDWKKALEIFLKQYAFERLRGFPKYREASLQAFRLVAREEKEPTLNMTKKIWNEFLRILELPENGEGANRKVNPLWFREDEWNKPLLTVVSELKQYDYNLIRWTEQMLRHGMAEKAYYGLERIRGISQKIGTLFLRDIAYVFEIQKDKVDDSMYFQPVDIWIRKASKVLIPEPLGKNDWEIAYQLACLCEKAGINGCLLNAGLWLLGTQIVGSDDYEEALRSPKNLAKYLNKYIEESTYWINEINTIIKSVN